MNVADLHLHTTASDGLMSPVEIVKRAAELGIKIISVTDHDTTEGTSAAQAAGEKFGIRVIPGVELSTELNKEEIHVLGYYIDHQSPMLQDKLSRLKKARECRIKEIIYKLQEENFAITWEEILAIAGTTGSIGRPHVARVMVAKGYAKTVKEVFTHWIGPGCPAFVERFKLSPAQAISAIHDAKGLAFLAHPGLLKSGLGVAQQLIPLGLDGIEAFHTEHNSSLTQRLLEFARQKSLFVSGGSDCHGYPDNTLMGRVKVDVKLLEPWLME